MGRSFLCRAKSPHLSILTYYPGLMEEEQEQGEFWAAADGEDREQPQEKSDFQSPGRNWEVEKLLPREHTECEEEILQRNRKAGFLQGYRKTVGVMEVRYARMERQIIVECRKTEEKILVLEGGREGQVLVETGKSKRQNLEGYGESERRLQEEVEVSTEIQVQEADAIRTEGKIMKNNRETEDHKRYKESTRGQTQGKDSEGQTQGGDSEGQTQGGDPEGQTQGGDPEGQTQGGDSEGQIQGGDAEGQTQGGDAEGQTQGGDPEGQTQGEDPEAQTQVGDDKAQVHRGDDEEVTEGHVSKEVGGNETRLTRGEGEAMEQIPSGYEGIEGWTSSGKIDIQPLRTDEDLSEQSPGAVGDIGSSPRRRHHLAPGTNGKVTGAEK
ncbi:sodium/potassium/calcium exchanger 1-like [Petaurus breviceps papuanus]|uniref:sodium/potassium/calcium exchanger 1-like n=1 Tax=Petaurus breviceps papuanus TaxID=3040969 RepID=UPI0036DD681F